MPYDEYPGDPACEYDADPAIAAAIADGVRSATQHELQQLWQRNNPKNLPCGPYTDRCGFCGGQSLWDDNAAYGCRDCDYIFIES